MVNQEIKIISEHACFGGVQGYYSHDSQCIGLPMRFSVFQPAIAKQQPLPVLFFLAGLTCTEETFMMKAGAQKVAAQLGIILVTCDTSPRATNIAGDAASWDFGLGAGFYVDATQAPWNTHYKMESYVTQELRQLICANFSVQADRLGIFGHSMGGHGALTLALRHPDLYQSVSAFAPIAAPSVCPWGQKAFAGYLGENQATWLAHDASSLMRQRQSPFPKGILIDQGLNDAFLETQLMPEQFEAACKQANQSLTLRRHANYDHGYYFVASFMEDHLRFHHNILSS